MSKGTLPNFGDLRRHQHEYIEEKMIQKESYDKIVLEIRSEKDVEKMRIVVKREYDSYELMRKALGLGKLNEVYDVFIYEDISNGKRVNNLFWGGYFEGDTFYGENMLGKIWMELIKK